jgi:C2 domain-containing protein
MRRLSLYLVSTLALLACAETDDGSGTKRGSTGNGGDGGDFTTSTGANGGSGGSCVDHWDCTAADRVCIASGCDLAWGRQFCFNGMSVELATKNPANGEDWDPLGGAPDPFVVCTLNEQMPPLLQTAYVDNMFDASWPDQFCLVFDDPAANITCTVWDFDDVSSDENTGAGVMATEASWLGAVRDPVAQGTVILDGLAGAFTIHVVPL